MSTLADHDSDAEMPAESEASDTGSYDFLFAPTEFRTVEAAAVRDIPDEDGATAPLDVSPTPEEPSASSSLEDEQPLEEPQPPELEAPILVADDDGAGRTVMRDHLPAASVQDAATGALPAVGVLRLPNGDPVVVDRGILVGRRPRADAWTGDGQPHLVQVDDPEGAVSRNHLRIDIDGRTVFVTDLNSTNGTTVAQGPAPARSLVPGEATPLASGAVVRLGDSVSFTYEAAAQPPSPLRPVSPPEARDEAESHAATAGWFRRRRHRNL